MSAVSIRPATEADIPAITRIYSHAVNTGTATFELEAPDGAEMTRRMRTLQDNGYPYIAATVDGALVGYAYAGPYRPRPAYRFAVEDSIYIDTSTHRRGIGRAVLKALIEESEKRGYRQMVAIIGDSANAPSIELHRAMGFHMVGNFENVGYKFGRWLDSVMMQRALGEGATTKP
jgi:phosphinothricin acetyltransferase